jgi:hypothetical protein
MYEFENNLKKLVDIWIQKDIDESIGIYIKDIHWFLFKRKCFSAPPRREREKVLMVKVYIKSIIKKTKSITLKTSDYRRAMYILKQRRPILTYRKPDAGSIVRIAA